MINTNLEYNLQHIRPYLGVLLVGSMALGFGLMLTSATKQLSQALEPNVIEGGGTLTLISSGSVQYGDTVSYNIEMDNPENIASSVYISTVCFQGTTMVFEKSVTQRATVRLYDQMEKEHVWNGESASCSATLLYRTAQNVVALDSVGFEVQDGPIY